MKNLSKYIFFSLVVLLVSCKEEKETPKVTYDATAKEKPAPKVSASQIKVADLPINFAGTNVLIHPIGDLNLGESDNAEAYESSRGASQPSFTVSNNNDYEITGYLQNIKFQEIGKDTITALTDKPILIETATYLKTIADKTKKHFMVYTLADSDTNKDGKIDINDIKSLYTSNLNGSNFLKLSQEFQELIDWNIIETQNRLYFRTIEDINKNGDFDKEDKVHYSYLDLLSKELKIEEYFPLK
jgi:hypothetical protein